MSVQLNTPPALDPVRSGVPPSDARGVESAGTTPKALWPFFRLAAIAPGVLRALRPLVARLVPLFSRSVREQTRRNAARIFGRLLRPAGY